MARENTTSKEATGRLKNDLPVETIESRIRRFTMNSSHSPIKQYLWSIYSMLDTVVGTLG